MFISKMKKLSWLRLNMVNAENVEAPNLLSNELRYIDWSYYRVSSYQFLPQKFRFSTYPSKHGILSKVGFVWHSEIRSALINWRTFCHIQIDALLSSIGERCTNLISLRLEEFRGSKGPGKTPFAFRLTHNLRKLNLSECFFEDGEILSDICCSGRHVDNRCSPNITIKEEASDEMRDSMLHDVVWMESFGGKRTWVWHESMVIKKIVDTIFGGLFPFGFIFDEGLVGMRARLQGLISQLKIGSGGVRMVGIWGLGGGVRYVIVNVLVFLDDVDLLDQFRGVSWLTYWFGDGDRIIITTRDEHLLRKHKVDHVSPVKLLSRDEAILLFNSHAYNKEKHIKDYEKLSLQVVSYADGLPLALKVLGSFLSDKDAEEWMSTMDRLRDILKWRLKSDAMEIFDACGFHPKIGIKVLIQKSLITIDSNGLFAMHDLIQEMGHYIVRREHPNNPERHSRSVEHEEENDQIQAIEFGDNIHSPQIIMIISKMKKLRWLRLTGLNNMHNKGNGEAPNCLSNELRYIYWRYYPASPFPDSFQATNLVFLKLDLSMQELLWKGYKVSVPLQGNR
ncbi:Toll/interleukin-1 receptor domain-containing protein [Tanacetum coccineum]